MYGVWCMVYGVWCMAVQEGGFFVYIAGKELMS